MQNTGKISLVHTSIVNNTWGSGFYNLGEGAIRNSIILNNNIDSSAQSPSNCINNNSGLITRGLLLGGDNNGIANYDMGSYERQTSD